jgi:hypothetical protein
MEQGEERVIEREEMIDYGQGSIGLIGLSKQARYISYCP